ncbi:MAG: DUF2207 domain-containing protein, partial [Candidatus Andersenbacteria bacterium]|nr:DUF2207 domain-containing protein [Candidatus Andersenbacteria bacterium]
MFTRVLVALVLATSVVVPVRVAQAKSYTYPDWTVDITVHEDGTFSVEEQITHTFDGSFSFAFREIEGRKLDDIQNLHVFDEMGVEVSDVEIERVGLAKKITWNYSAQDETRTWTVAYDVTGGLGYFADHDELYWNAVSAEGRDVTIQNVTVTVHLPEGATASQLQHAVQYRPRSLRDARSEVLDDETIVFEGTYLSPGDHFTIVAGWPVGITDRPIRLHVVTFWSSIAVAIGIFLVGLSVLLVLWRRYGKELRPLGSIYARYEPPEGVDPELCNVVLGMTSKKTDAASMMIVLAREGQLEIADLRSSEQAGVVRWIRKATTTPEFELRPRGGGSEAI